VPGGVPGTRPFHIAKCYNPPIAQTRESGLVAIVGRFPFLQATAMCPDDSTRQPAPDSEPTRQTSEHLPGEQMGPYRLLQRVGEGGMGEVWVAEQREPVHRTVAVKVIKVGMDTRQVVARFEAERQALALMDHPGIAKMLDAGTTAMGRAYFVMEYVQGEPLTTYCDRHRLSTADRLQLFIRVCEAVQHAHQKGVIHRDLKPSNVLVAIQGDQPVPKIIDFGIAKATARRLTDQTVFTELGVLIGTPEYMSPEQAEMTGLDIDTRSDVYSLGVMLYELLAGVLPFDARSLRQAGLDGVRRQIREVDPPRPSTRVSASGDASTVAARNRRTEPTRLAGQLRGDLDWIAMKALDKDRTRRYAAVSELAADIGRHLSHQVVMAGPPSAVYRARKFVRRHRFGVAAASAAAVLIVAFAITASVQAQRIARERDNARMAATKAEQINNFVVGMLGSADPRVTGRDVTVASVLDAANSRVERELAGQPEVKASVLTTLGTTYEGLGLFDPARKCLHAALDATVAAYGREHPEVARAIDRLAGVAEDDGDLREAERLRRDALAMLGRLGQAAGADAAYLNGNLARVLQGLGDSAAAETLYRETLTLQRGLYGDRSAEVAATLNNLGVLLGQRGDWAGAEPLHREALDIIRAVRGSEHPEVAAALNTLGAVLEAKGDLAGAERSYRQSLDMRRRLLGPEHPDTTRSMYALAYLLRAKGDPESAARLGRDVLALRGRVLADSHPMVAASMAIVGLSLLDLRRAGEAEPLLRESLALRQKSLPPGHWLIASAESTLGECLTAEGQYAEAETLLLRAHASLESSRGKSADARVVDQATRRVVALYEAWGKAGTAALWRTRLAPSK
jgi:eukaryotic-like serine/threonine-protein kinase